MDFAKGQNFFNAKVGFPWSELFIGSEIIPSMSTSISSLVKGIVNGGPS